jgi:hypothetical protein
MRFAADTLSIEAEKKLFQVGEPRTKYQNVSNGLFFNWQRPSRRSATGYYFRCWVTERPSAFPWPALVPDKVVRPV